MICRYSRKVFCSVIKRTGGADGLGCSCAKHRCGLLRSGGCSTDTSYILGSIRDNIVSSDHRFGHNGAGDAKPSVSVCFSLHCCTGGGGAVVQRCTGWQYPISDSIYSNACCSDATWHTWVRRHVQQRIDSIFSYEII